MDHPPLARLVAIHSLTWLVVANAVGVLLAVLLLVPQLGDLMIPFTYGRWVPVHLDLQLYGWCSLPLVGLLLHLYRVDHDRGSLGAWGLGGWSASLLIGALSVLAGGSSGKLFLEWSGIARWTLFGAQVCLFLVLLTGFNRTRRTSAAQRGSSWWRGLLLVVLASIPFLLFWASRPEVYPPINPDSGGATGSSLLGSTLGIVALLITLPLLLGLRLDKRDQRPVTRMTLVVFVLHAGWFAMLELLALPAHGDESHHSWLQIFSLTSLTVWLPLLRAHLRRFDWPAASRPWLGALGAWGLLLVATGVLGFLPGVLERWKFTNALVAHAHVAMAGLVTALDVLVLQVLLRSPFPGGSARVDVDPFAQRFPFLLWQGGNLLGAVVLLVLGTREGIEPALLFRQDLGVQMLYFLRLVGGLCMMVASVTWLAGLLAKDAGPAPGMVPSEVPA